MPNHLHKLNRKLSSLLELKAGDYHAKYAPDSKLHQSQYGRDVRDAALAQSGKEGKGTANELHGNVRRQGMFKATATHEPLNLPDEVKAIDTATAAAKKDHKGSMLEAEHVRHAKKGAELKAKERYTGDKIRQKVAESQDRVAGGKGSAHKMLMPELDRHVQATRKYMTDEAREGRKIVKAAKGVRATAMTQSQIDEIKSRKITGRKVGAGMSAADRARAPIEVNVAHYRTKLNEGVAAAQERAKGSLAQVKESVTKKIFRSMSRGTRLVDKDGQELLNPANTRYAETESPKLWEKLAEHNPQRVGSEPLEKGERRIVARALRSPNETKMPRGSEARVTKVQGRIKDLTEAASGGYDATQKAKAAIFKEGKIFTGAPALAKEVTPRQTYPHLKKIGVALAGASMLAGGAAVAKHYIDKKKERLSDSSILINLGITNGAFARADTSIKKNLVKASPALYTRIHTRIPEHVKIAIVDEAVKGGGVVPKAEFDYLKIQNERMAGEAHKNSEDLAARIDRKENRPKQSSLRKSEREHVRSGGFIEGHAQASKEKNDTIDNLISGHIKDKKILNEKLKETENSAMRRGVWGAIGTAAAGAAGVGVGRITKKQPETQFASKDDDATLRTAVHAGLGGAVTGGVLGSLSLLRHGTSVKEGLKEAGKAAAVIGGIVGGGTYVGGKILGNPDKGDKAPITKRAALGGGVIGSGLGAAAGIIGTNTKWGRNKLSTIGNTTKGALSYLSRPARWIASSGRAAAPFTGAAVGGAGLGIYSGDEGSGQDAVQALKHHKQNLSSKERIIRFDAPAKFGTNKSVAPDRYKKNIIEHEHDRRDANYGRSAAAGAILASQFRKRLNMPVGRAALAGGAAGLGAQAIVRNTVTHNQKDQFGEKTISAKRTESAPWIAGGVTAAAIGAGRLYKRHPSVQNFVKTYFGSKTRPIMFATDEELYADQRAAHRAIYGNQRRRTSYPQAQRYWRNLNRAGDALGTAKSHITGKPDLDARGREKTPVYKKPWAVAAAGATVIAGGIAGRRHVIDLFKEAPHGSVRHGLAQAYVQGGGIGGMAKELIPKMVRDFAHSAKKEVGDLMEKPLKPVLDAVKTTAGELPPLDRRIAAKTAEKAETFKKDKSHINGITNGDRFMSSRIRPINLQVQYIDNHIRRERRDKHWYETTAAHRAGLGVAGLGTIATGVAAVRYGRRAGASEAAKEVAIKAQNAARFGIHKDDVAKEWERHAAGNPRVIVPHNFRKPDPEDHAASSKLKPIYFEDKKRNDHAAAATAIGATTGAFAASQYINGRELRPGEDATGLTLMRRHRAFPLAHHEGIGIGPKQVAEIDNRKHPLFGSGRVSRISTDKFGWGGKVYVVGKQKPNLDAAKKARNQIGKEYPYNLLTNTCTDFVDCAKGKPQRIVSRQWRQAGYGAVAGAAVGYGAAKAIGAYRNRDQKMSAKLHVISLAKKDEKQGMSTGRKVAIVGGIGATAVGASMLPAAATMLKIQGRQILHGAQHGAANTRGLRNLVSSPKADPNLGGKIVADYVDASQKALNRGPVGWASGKILEHARANPDGLVGRAVRRLPMFKAKDGVSSEFKISHYQRFRAGPQSALGHWDWEAGKMLEHRSKPRVNPGTGKATVPFLGKVNKNSGKTNLEHEYEKAHYEREAAHGEIKSRMYDRGENERDAILKTARTTTNPQSQAYFDRLAASKKEVYGLYGKAALAAPTLTAVGAGTAAIAANRPDNNRKTKMLSSLLDQLILS